MSKTNLRQAFVDFFVAKNHLNLPCKSVLSQQDPTLLFINSGMAAMKEYFLGAVQPPASRVVTCQPCLRVGGKHNDLEEVGQTTRHHTLFEMLGNFSFGDYGRKEAISMAWEFVTKVLGISPEKLWVTVHPEDSASRAVWCDIGVEQILDVTENRWAAGDTGPRGYCTEIFYDFGDTYQGALPNLGDTGDRYIEIWNIVLMEECVEKDGTVNKLPAPCIDTGMGLERMEAVLCNSNDSYDSCVISQLRSLANKPDSVSARILADHARAIVFLVADGVQPGPCGRNYVLRRIMRRALRHQITLKQSNLLGDMAAKTIALMSSHYPHLAKAADLVRTTIQTELDKFMQGWTVGSALLERELASLDAPLLPGKVAFTLYDTHGFPLDLTESICKERGIEVDHAGFKKEMSAQQKRSAWQCKDSVMYSGIDKLDKTQFVGYELCASQAKILQLYLPDGTPTNTLTGCGWVVLDRTPFYAESGGQACDNGFIDYSHVVDVQKVDGVWVHKVERGAFTSNQEVSCTIDRSRRAVLRAHHSATHLLCAAIKKYCPDVVLHGSAVEVDKLRLDFAYPETLDRQFLARIERTINDWIAADIDCTVEHMKFKDAIDAGSATLPNKLYPSIVRVVSFDKCDIQLCGGTHVNSTAELGGFMIVGHGSIGAGVKRIFAKSGLALVQHALEQCDRLGQIAGMLKTKPADIERKIVTLIEKGCETKPAASIDISVYKNNEITLVYAYANSEEVNTRKPDQLAAKYKASIVVLSVPKGSGSAAVLCRVDPSVTDKYNAQTIALNIAHSTKGGGNANFAQAFSTDASGISRRIDSLVARLESQKVEADDQTLSTLNAT